MVPLPPTSDHGRAVGWHLTSPRAAQRIAREGLQPRLGPRSRALGEPRPAIFLFTTASAALEGLETWLEDAFPRGARLTLLRVHVPATAARHSVVPWELQVMDPIGPEHIDLMAHDVLACTAEEIRGLDEGRRNRSIAVTRPPR